MPIQLEKFILWTINDRITLTERIGNCTCQLTALFYIVEFNLIVCTLNKNNRRNTTKRNCTHHEVFRLLQGGRGMVWEDLQSHRLFGHQFTGSLIHLAVMDAQPTEDGESLQWRKSHCSHTKGLNLQAVFTNLSKLLMANRFSKRKEFMPQFKTYWPNFTIVKIEKKKLTVS